LIHPDLLGFVAKSKQMSIIYEAQDNWLISKAQQSDTKVRRTKMMMTSLLRHRVGIASVSVEHRSALERAASESRHQIASHVGIATFQPGNPSLPST
jgi:hypothetical protein